MKVCVFGAGAIGGLIASRLAQQTAAEVSVIARGPHLEAIRRNGLVLRTGASESRIALRASADAAELGVQDVVIIAVKTCSLPASLAGMAPLIGPDTMVVPAMNGVPWWFFSGFGGALQGLPIEGIDPGGRIAAAIPERQVLGCVVYPTAFVAEPGVVQHTGRWDMHLGEPDGSLSARSGALQALLESAGFSCKRTSEIRREIWTKLIGNCSFNPVAALAQAPLDRLAADPDVVCLMRGLMLEVIAVGNALGLDVAEDPDRRIDRMRTLGSIKPSMLQDLEGRRPMEHESLTGAVLAIGTRLGVEVPLIQAVHGLIRQRANSMGLQ
ncbi:ketopantoate reductase family protein [Lacisediminimonas profundi]|uniref:ketopantoate reductase family protein n=1 Tax=Lacisediminimonas profundi TaxID=2603856 RepID=UPI00124B1C28|nr:2-dehydropantoate 2-reductase [Lacisediminimonas profundi]